MIETLDQQSLRSYEAFRAYETDLGRHINLLALQNTNDILCYRLLLDHIDEMLPILYTPTVGQASQQFSHIYRGNRGLSSPTLAERAAERRCVVAASTYPTGAVHHRSLSEALARVGATTLQLITDEEFFRNLGNLCNVAPLLQYSQASPSHIGALNSPGHFLDTHR